MIYWTTGSITSSMRFYKENFKNNLQRVDARYVAKYSSHYRSDSFTLLRDDSNGRLYFCFRMEVFVPTGLAAFPMELLHCPKSWAQIKYRNIVSYTFMPRGGHFAAFEEPHLLADDIFSFVKKVEKF